MRRASPHRAAQDERSVTSAETRDRRRASTRQQPRRSPLHATCSSSTRSLYGVMAYSVARRSNEVGIRMALGADRRNVVVKVVRETMTLVAAGVVIGLAAAWGATRLIASALFGVTAMDPPTLALAIAAMMMIALLAGYIPARRAAAVNPVMALRQE